MSRIRLYSTALIWSMLSSLAVAAGEEDHLRAVADGYMAAMLELNQPDAYFSNLPNDRHDRFFDNSPQGLKKFADTEDTTLKGLMALDTSKLSPTAQIFLTTFQEKVEGKIGLRVCRQELWGVSQMGAAHTDLDLLVRFQPVSSADERRQALDRWHHAARWFEQEIKNLEQGLELGYSAPKRVVDRVLKQLRGITETEAASHPYMALAERGEDAAFVAQFQQLLEEYLLPAMLAYQEYLAGDYRARARDALGLHAQPDGRACYIAAYRYYTTLQRTPEQVFEIGSQAVANNKAGVSALGKEIYNTQNFEDTVASANADSSQRFESPEQMQAFYDAVVTRSIAAMPKYFHALPSTAMVVEPIPEHQQGSGRSAHYRPGNGERPGTFAYDPTGYAQETFGSAELVTVHEGFPGHHMQIGLAQDLEEFHPLQRTFWNSAYGEGWARYAEALSEEAGLYQSKSARILRRTWPARGMVVDPGLHLLGWSNEQAIEYLVASGRPNIAGDPDALLDRMAVLPAQLTAYDSGALEIFALRREMEQALGDDFDIKEFHRLVLMHGMVPLAQLRKQVEAGR